MFDRRSQEPEWLDMNAVTASEELQNFAEMIWCNRWFGSQRVLLKLLNQVLNNQLDKFGDRPLRILDIGCGCGDLLQTTYCWLQKKGITAELIGIDNNERAINMAKHRYPHIHFKIQNALDLDLTQRFDLVVLNSFCHHLSDEEIINLIRQLQLHTTFAILINDLHRHLLAYISIKIISQLARFSTVGQHDGPLSVLRAFKKHELIHLTTKANNKNFIVRWYWPFRWGVIIPLNVD